MSTQLNEVLGDLLIYREPDLFKQELLPPIHKGKHFNIKNLEKYHNILSSIDWFFKKTARYELYFKEFYPPEGDIKNHEALEHHIHAYLEDLDTLRNKLIWYTDCLKNDIGKIASNKKEIKDLFLLVRKRIYGSFKNISEIRNPHRHEGFKFPDKYINDITIAETMLTHFKGHLTKHAIEKFTKQRVEAFEIGKEKWAKNVQSHKYQSISLIDELISNTKGYLYKFLDIEHININFPE